MSIVPKVKSLAKLTPMMRLVTGWMLAWGIWLVMPWQTFDSSSAYYRLSEVAPEWAYGMYAVVCSVIIIQRHWLRARILGLYGGLILASALFGTYTYHNWVGTALPTYGTLVIGFVASIIVEAKRRALK